jgi:hypothetical protein
VRDVCASWRGGGVGGGGEQVSHQVNRRDFRPMVQAQASRLTHRIETRAALGRHTYRLKVEIRACFI